ncbi:MAG: peptidoglycan-binding domain-containing protein [Acidimicrobiia bacterium]
MRSTLVAALAAVLAPLAFLVGAYLLVDEEGADPSPVGEVVTIELELVTYRDARPVQADLTWSEPLVVPSPGFSGLVTAVFAVAGEPLGQGDPVLAIDDVLRVAVVTERPFFRGLSVGDSGPDVERLQAVLVRLGYLSGEVDGRFGSATAAAVRALAEAAGVSRPDGSFDRSLVVWLPAGLVVPEAIHTKVGEVAPSQGEPLVTARPEVLGVLLRAEGDLDLEPGLMYVLDLGEAAIPIDPATLDTDPSGRQRLTETQPPPATSGEGAGDTTTVEGILRLARQETVYAVPASAVVVTEQGGACIWLAADGGGYRPLEVEIVSGSPAGQTLLRPWSDGSSRVVVNPGLLPDGRMCG